MHIQVILSSTRPGRVGERVAKWVTAAAKQQLDAQVELVDIASFHLPFFNEAISPRFNPHRQPGPEAARWLAKIAAADGYIIVTPEYNHSIPASLKNALDFLDLQVAKKPVAIVSYGTVGGARAAEHLKAILLEARAAVVPEAVALIGRPTELFDEQGTFLGDTQRPTSPPAALKQVLHELSWWAKTLKAGRIG